MCYIPHCYGADYLQSLFTFERVGGLFQVKKKNWHTDLKQKQNFCVKLLKLYLYQKIEKILISLLICRNFVYSCPPTGKF